MRLAAISCSTPAGQEYSTEGSRLCSPQEAVRQPVFVYLHRPASSSKPHATTPWQIQTGTRFIPAPAHLRDRGGSPSAVRPFPCTAQRIQQSRTEPCSAQNLLQKLAPTQYFTLDREGLSDTEDLSDLLALHLSTAPSCVCALLRTAHVYSAVAQC